MSAASRTPWRMSPCRCRSLVVIRPPPVGPVRRSPSSAPPRACPNRPSARAPAADIPSSPTGATAIRVPSSGMDATPLADDDPPADVPTLQGMVRQLRGRVAELEAQVVTREAKVAELQGKLDALLKHRPSSEPSAAPPTITTRPPPPPWKSKGETPSPPDVIRRTGTLQRWRTSVFTEATKKPPAFREECRGLYPCKSVA